MRGVFVKCFDKLRGIYFASFCLKLRQDEQLASYWVYLCPYYIHMSSPRRQFLLLVLEQ